MQKSKKSNSKFPKQIQSLQIIHNEAQKNRIARHQRLIQMIHQYRRTGQQQQKLYKMRIKTALEIDMRYKMSHQNKFYGFPRNLQKDNDDQYQDGLNILSRNVYYDLRSQNQLVRMPSQSEFLEISRRVKSLDQVGARSQRIIKKAARLETDFDIEQYKSELNTEFKRSKTVRKHQIILPVLGKKLQNLKTENNQATKHKIQRLIQKKLITEAYAPIEGKIMKVNWKYSKKK